MKQRRLLLALGAVLAAAAAAVVLVVVGTGSGSSTSDRTTTTAGAAASSPLHGIPQHGVTLGSDSAPATLLVFEDPQCPYCRDFMQQTFPTVVSNFVATGRVKLAYRGIAIIGPDSVRGLRAIYGAAPQNKAWSLVEALYGEQGVENSGWLTNATIRDAAGTAGVNATKALARAGSSAVTAQLTNAASEARAYGVSGTPSFVLVRPLAGPRLLNVTSFDPTTFSDTLAAALQ